MILELLTTGLGTTNGALLLSRVAAGSFFAISGYHKLFNRERHAKLARTMVTDGVPFPRFNEWWVPGVELLAGATLCLGFFTALSSLALLIICAVACMCEGRGKVAKYLPIDACDVIDDYLYLPEVVYMVLLGGLWFAGGGEWSLDAILF